MCNDVRDVWRSGTFFLYICKVASESKKRHQDCLMSSTQSFYGPCLQSVAHSLTCCFSGNVPLLHTSRCHTTWLSFTRPSPALVLQATNTGVRRPGYEASWCPMPTCPRAPYPITAHPATPPSSSCCVLTWNSHRLVYIIFPIAATRTINMCHSNVISLCRAAGGSCERYFDKSFWLNREPWSHSRDREAH